MLFITVIRRRFQPARTCIGLFSFLTITLALALPSPAQVDEPAASAAAGFFTNDLGMKFVYIEPGSFMMGSPSGESDLGQYERQHRVTLTRGFYMQTTEVTQGQWQAVMGGNPSFFLSCGGDDCPVESVSWDDVQDFIRKLNQRSNRTYRLPTEAEWEYACRAGSTGPFNTGSCLSTSQANYNGSHPLSGCSKGNFREKTVPVASFSPNAWGLYDMHGNVAEWCSDWYGDYPSGSVSDPTGPLSGGVGPITDGLGAVNRVYRGGFWGDSDWNCRSAHRYGFSVGYRVFDAPDFDSPGLGFRLVGQ